MRHAAAVCLVLGAVTVTGTLAARGGGPNDLPTYPDLGQYRNFFSSLCGKNRVDEKPAAIPEIGCFAIKAGGSLDGRINGRAVSIRLDADGNETFTVDGTKIQATGGSATNDPLVTPSASGFAFCTAPNDCPVRIDTMMRRPGEFASFDVARQFKPRAFVTNQENWDYERARAQPAKP